MTNSSDQEFKTEVEGDSRRMILQRQYEDRGQLKGLTDRITGERAELYIAPAGEIRVRIMQMLGDVSFGCTAFSYRYSRTSLRGHPHTLFRRVGNESHKRQS